MSKKVFIVLGSVVAISACCVGLVLSGSAYMKINSLSGENRQMIDELTSVRQRLYVAAEDIEEGERIVFEGDGANMRYEQVYSSFDSSLFLDGSEEGYALSGIKAGSPVLRSLVGDKPVEYEPEVVVQEVPASYDMPYHITAKYVDTKNQEIAKSTQINLSKEMTEEEFAAAAADIDGYYLQSVTIGKAKVYSYGVARLKTGDGNKMVYYYTDQTGLSRTELTEDVEVIFTYSKKEQTAKSLVKLIGIPESEEASEDENKSNEQQENAEKAIIYDDIAEDVG